MAGRGPMPKEPEKRERRNATPEETTLVAGSKVKAPALPGSRKLLPATRTWYRTWCQSPQAAQFLSTDWQRLHMLAELVDAFFRTDEAKTKREMMAEIRLQEAKLGATPEDRLRLRWRFREAEEGEERAERSQPKKRSSRRRGDPRLKLVEGKGT